MTTISLGHFGDARREAAGILLHDRLVGNCVRGVSVRGLGGDRAGEIRLTRFLHNDAVSIEEMVATAAARTAERCEGRDVLVIQDTTVVRSDGGGGLYLHVAIAVDGADGMLLGLFHASFLNREHGKRATREARAIEDKQSQRWLDGAQAAARVCASARRITMIADRESDIAPVISACLRQKCIWCRRIGSPDGCSRPVNMAAGTRYPALCTTRPPWKFLWRAAEIPGVVQKTKVFCFFSSEKKAFLPLIDVVLPFSPGRTCSPAGASPGDRAGSYLRSCA
jgi:hypothetical protein